VLRSGMAAFTGWFGVATSGVMGQDAKARSDAAPTRLGLLRTADLGGLPTVEVSIAGRSGRWLIDTGASRHVISPAVGRDLGLASHGERDVTTLGGRATLAEVDLPEMQVSGWSLPPASAWIAPLDGYWMPTGEVVEGILGAPAWRRGTWHLDFANERLMIAATSATSAAAPVLAASGPVAARQAAVQATLPLDLRDGLPVIDLALGHRPAGRFLVDTGFAGTLLIHARAAGALVQQAEAAGQSLPSLAVDELAGRVTARFARMEAVRVGELTLHDVPIALETRSSARRGRAFDALAGLVGSAFLESAGLTLDVAAGRLGLHWSGGAPSWPGGWGFGLQARGPGHMRIGSVIAQGPAGLAGLRPGADLLAVDARPLDGLTPSTLWARLRHQEEVTLEVRQDGAVRSVRLRRDRFFPRVE
jgi:predicted aspartyl protease